MFQWYVKNIAIFLYVRFNNYIMSHKYIENVAKKYHITTVLFFFCCIKMSHKYIENVAKKITLIFDVLNFYARYDKKRN
jgi:hypothetical protein